MDTDRVEMSECESGEIRDSLRPKSPVRRGDRGYQGYRRDRRSPKKSHRKNSSPERYHRERERRRRSRSPNPRRSRSRDRQRRKIHRDTMERRVEDQEVRIRSLERDNNKMRSQILELFRRTKVNYNSLKFSHPPTGSHMIYQRDDDQCDQGAEEVTKLSDYKDYEY